ncbi:hypothetical protein GGQ74_002880 [Desulfobaculum xiamenense]|uniref:Uncharacterized protein n=1 Tax=Desulfobaculum xiamenense TaxID=995050 RepID=A0A846QS37_9BACT|nr:glycosyltransferase family 4 protein [Desulfobaculum xiamenense]NJB69183.1 hypothetical protein [Desulfobaculum xiamenense]
MRDRICIVSPHPNPELNPTIVNLIRELSGRFAGVDVLCPQGDFAATLSGGSLQLQERASAMNPAAPVRPGLRGKIANAVLRRIRPHLFARGEHAAVIGVDPRGIAMAHRLNRVARLPLAYASFEIMFEEELTAAEQAMHAAEREACAHVDLALVQDSRRAEALERETGLARERMVLVPNAPAPEPIPESRWLRDRLGLRDDRRIVLHAGTPAGWSGLHLWPDMLATWPERFALVVHCRADIGPRTRAHLARLGRGGRLYVTHGPLPAASLASLFASADFGLASYMPVPDDWTSGLNVYHLGLSSGKVGWYAMCGLPMLAGNLPVFRREFERFGCGAVYERAAQTGELLDALDRDYDFHSLEARRFYDQRLDPSDGIERFCARIEELCHPEKRP